MAGVDPNAVFQMLAQLDDNTVATLLAQLLQSKPELAPGLVTVAIPDLTYAPTKAMTERRCSGVVKELNAQMGIGLIACPELSQVFGCDVIVARQQASHCRVGMNVNFAVTLNAENKPQAFDVVDANTGAGPCGGGACAGGKGGGCGMGMGGGMGGCGEEQWDPSWMGKGGCDQMMQQMMGMMGMGDGGGGKKGKGKGKQVVLGEYLGVIKSYNTEKGFGFIACDALKAEQEGDVYLHQKHVGEFQVGSEVKFQAYLHNGRLQGRDLQDASGQVGPQAGMGKGGGGGDGGPSVDLGMYAGKIKSFNWEKGYGFIQCDQLAQQGYQGDVFVHQRNVLNFQVGDDVMFTAYLHNGSRLQGRDLQPGQGGDMAAPGGGAGGGMNDMAGLAGLAGAMRGGCGDSIGAMGGMGGMGGMAGMGGGCGDIGDPSAKRARMF